MKYLYVIQSLIMFVILVGICLNINNEAITIIFQKLIIVCFLYLSLWIIEILDILHKINNNLEKRK
jgi:hypothetical protein